LVTQVPDSRKGFSLVTLADSLYIVGGTDSNGSNQLPVLRYDSTADLWETLDQPPVGIGGRASLVVLGNFIHTMGGDINGTDQEEHLTYQAIFTVLIPAISR
jgi:N-acetylneuraminic acid mutarotase